MDTKALIDRQERQFAEFVQLPAGQIGNITTAKNKSAIIVQSETAQLVQPMAGQLIR